MKTAPNSIRKDLGLNIRYIDDILNINGKNFLEDAKNIYPISLPLEKTNSCNNKRDFLDLSIECSHNQTVTSLYNKTDAFDFTVIRYPVATSNIHVQIGYNTFYAQIIRIARICSTSSHFENKIRLLCDAFLERGFEKTDLLLCIKKFTNNYNLLILKFGFSNYQFSNMCKVFLKVS